MTTDKTSRDDLALYTMGVYDGDVAALEAKLSDDEGARAMLAEEAELELLLRDAAASGTFCANCDDLIPDTTEPVRCSSCGTAVAPGGYTVERVLVANAHGRMYVARDADGTRVALKELAFVQSPSADSVAAFEREAKFLRALAHPAIPRFRAAFEEGAGVHTRYYLAQELVEGTALDARLDDHFYSEKEIIDIARQVLTVLVYLQSLSPMVIHRDIKPANLLRKADGSIAVVDFGAAHVQGTTAGSTSIGTFGYMPLEQLAGQVDATTDGYALGASLVHLLTRREPWRILTLTTLGPVNVSTALNAFLQKLVSPEPTDRFANAAAAVDALDKLGTEPVAIVKKKRAPMSYAMNVLVWPLMLLILAGAVVGSIAIIKFSRHETPAVIETVRGPGETVDVHGPVPPPASSARTRGVVASGYIAAKAPVVLAVSAGSRIAKLNVDNGDRVTKGQIVAVLDDDSLRAQLEVANARLRDASRALQRSRVALAADAATHSEVENAMGAVEIASAEVHVISEKLEATKIRSPVDATVLEVLARPGEVVAAGDGDSAGIMRLADLSVLVAEANVSEAVLKDIAIDQYVEVTTDSARDKPYTGRVREISPTVDTTRGTVLVRAYLDASTDSTLKPGTAVQVRFGSEPLLRPAPQVPAPARWKSDAFTDITKENVALDQLLLDVAKGCNVAVVIPDYVKSSVGATVGAVPCSSAFETFLASAGLDYRYDGHIARVGSRHDLLESDIETAEHGDVLARLGRKEETLPVGKAMELAFHNAPLPDVLKAIAQVGGVKLVLPDYVKGTVSAFGTGVPWDAALRAVLAANNLDFRYIDNGRLVRIGTVHDLMDEEREALERK